MIPPVQPVRLRSIARYMKDSEPTLAQLPEAELNRRALATDDLMLEAFEELDNELTWAALQEKRNLTHDQCVQELTTGRLEAWQSVTAQFMPAISYQDAED